MFEARNSLEFLRRSSELPARPVILATRDRPQIDRGNGVFLAAFSSAVGASEKAVALEPR